MPGRVRVGRVPVKGHAGEADEHGQQAGDYCDAQRGIADVQPERSLFLELEVEHATASTHIMRLNSLFVAQLM
jgi:hypothetical protein